MTGSVWHLIKPLLPFGPRDETSLRRKASPSAIQLTCMQLQRPPSSRRRNHDIKYKINMARRQEGLTAYGTQHPLGSNIAVINTADFHAAMRQVIQ